MILDKEIKKRGMEEMRRQRRPYEKKLAFQKNKKKSSFQASIATPPTSLNSK